MFFFNEISRGCTALKDISPEEYEKLCDESKGDKCPYFLTVESAKYYATVRNGLYAALGDPVDFGRKVGEHLKAASEKSIEIHDRSK